MDNKCLACFLYEYIHIIKLSQMEKILSASYSIVNQSKDLKLIDN